MATHYRQCDMSRGASRQTAWIPEALASLGGYLRILGENGWRICRVGRNRLEESYLAERSRDYLNTRKASDI